MFEWLFYWMFQEINTQSITMFWCWVKRWFGFRQLLLSYGFSGIHKKALREVNLKRCRGHEGGLGMSWLPLALIFCSQSRSNRTRRLSRTVMGSACSHWLWRRLEDDTNAVTGHGLQVAPQCCWSVSPTLPFYLATQEPNRTLWDSNFKENKKSKSSTQLSLLHLEQKQG